MIWYFVIAWQVSLGVTMAKLFVNCVTETGYFGANCLFLGVLAGFFFAQNAILKQNTPPKIDGVS